MARSFYQIKKLVYYLLRIFSVSFGIVDVSYITLCAFDWRATLLFLFSEAVYRNVGDFSKLSSTDKSATLSTELSGL